MDASNLRDRIWYGLCETQRKAYYYSDLSRSLKTRYLLLSFFSVLAPAFAVLIFQTEWTDPVKTWTVAILLFFVSAVQGYVLHFNLASDATASRIMGNQLGKLAQKWRLLWIHQELEGIEEWIDHLEDTTNHLTVEHLSTYNDKLNIQCQEEAYNELEGQFGR